MKNYLIIAFIATFLAFPAHATYNPPGPFNNGITVNLLNGFGARCDESFFTDGAITSGTSTLTSTMTTFTPTMAQGQDVISVVGAGAAGAPLITTIAAYVSPHVVTLAANAGTTVTGAYGTFGYNNNAAWAAAETTVLAAGGGVIQFPPHCAATHIITYRNVMLDGQNQTSCFLRQLPGSNQDFIVTENEATLEDSGYNFGPTGVFNGFTSSPLVPSWFGIKNCVVDGNSIGGNTSGRIWASWGNMLIIQDATFEQAAGDNLYTGAATAYAYNATNYRAAEEGVFNNVTTRNAGGYAWKCHGPHDASWHNIIGLESAHGFLQESGTGTIGSPNGYGCGGNFELMHFYTMTDNVNMTFKSGGQANFIYDDFGGAVIDMPTANFRAIQCGIGGVPCLQVTAQDVNIVGANISPQIFSGIANTHLVDLSGVFDQISGGDVSLYNLAAGNIGVYMGANFESYSGAINGGIGLTGDACAFASGSFDSITFTGANCNIGIGLGTSERDNIFNMFTYSTTTTFGNNALTGAATPATSDTVTVDNSTSTDGTGGTRYFQVHSVKMESLIDQGPTFTISGCSTTALVGGATAGEFLSGTTGTCTITITMGNTATAPHGWTCLSALDQNSGVSLVRTAGTTTSVTFSGTTTSGDKIIFGCPTGY